MGRKKEYIGLRVGNLTVIALDGPATTASKRRKFTLLCDCGCTITKSSSDIGKLTRGSSCGCKPRVSHEDVFGAGDKFGKLLVLEKLSNDKQGGKLWRVVCDCGEKHVLKTKHVMEGKTHLCCKPCNNTEKSCYTSWEAMKSRCCNENGKFYEYYGGRGITYDPRWEEFENFYTDMGERPDAHVLDRANPDLGYTKENCRWVNRSESAYNTRKQSNNTSGKTGVKWSKKDRVWVASIDFEGKSIRLGAFKDKQLAIDKRVEAELHYFGYTKP